eukprot:2788328-Heterocapsa_arctica.AAC.1
MTPGEARRWIATYHHKKQVVRAHQLPTSQAGPTTRRAPLHLKCKLGRNCYKSKNKLTAILDAHGNIQTDPVGIDAALWNSRKAFWCSTPDSGGAGSGLLKAYMVGRNCSLPDAPKPNLHRVAGAILAAGDSVAGIDGWPYEVYHVGVNFFSHLFGNA